MDEINGVMIKTHKTCTSFKCNKQTNKQTNSIIRDKQLTVSRFWTVDPEEMIISPEQTISMFNSSLLTDCLTIHTSSVKKIQFYTQQIVNI